MISEPTENTQSTEYGQEDASYQAAGGLEGITQLVDDFYLAMDSLDEAKVIRAMHPADLTESRRKLTYFLSGWLGGPKLYSQNYGGIIIPKAHEHLPIGHNEAEAWLACMQQAVDQQSYAADFKGYLMTQLRVPAERIEVVCQHFKKQQQQQ